MWSVSWGRKKREMMNSCSNCSSRPNIWSYSRLTKRLITNSKPKMTKDAAILRWSKRTTTSTIFKLKTIWRSTCHCSTRKQSEGQSWPCSAANHNLKRSIETLKARFCINWIKRYWQMKDSQRFYQQSTKSLFKFCKEPWWWSQGICRQAALNLTPHKNHSLENFRPQRKVDRRSW